MGARRARGLPELWLVDTASDSVVLFRRSEPELDDFDVAVELGEGEMLTTPLLLRLEIGIRELFDR